MAMRTRPSRRQSGAVTIHDVAKAANVSSMTVSRVINGEKNVREATRAKVDAAIAALNYKPNPAARSLASADDVRVGLLYSNPSAGYLSEFLVGGLDQCAASNLQLVVEKCEPGRDEADVAKHLIASGVDGLILPPPLCDAADVLDVVIAAGIPAVAVATGAPRAEIAAVSIDDFAAARAMTAHLIAAGHRRIGFIIGNPNQTASARRRDGYLAALAGAGIGEDPWLMVQGYFTYRSGLDAAEQLLSGNRPDAIFASNDDMAAAAVAVAHRHHLDVPGDLAVVGFDDTQLATTIWPELTTIRQPIADMSRAAVELLADEIRARRAGEAPRHRHLTLDFALIARGSA